MQTKGFKYRYNQLTEDNCSWLVHWFIRKRHECLRIVSGVRVKLIARIVGVQIGRDSVFYGVPYFFRAPKSTISIVKNCAFRSDKTTNLIGLNHKCIIATRTEGAIIKMGTNCRMSGVSLGAWKEIRLGNNVLIGANTIIIDGDGHNDRNNSHAKAIIIHDNVWIGANCTILKGIEIGKNSIIGANSVVTKNIPENVIAVGNPCLVIGKRINFTRS